MDSGKKYFPLSLDQLRAIGSWAADCAERALPVYEAHTGSDPRRFVDQVLDLFFVQIL